MAVERTNIRKYRCSKVGPQKWKCSWRFTWFSSVPIVNNGMTTARIVLFSAV